MALERSLDLSVSTTAERDTIIRALRQLMTNKGRVNVKFL